MLWLEATVKIFRPWLRRMEHSTEESILYVHIENSYFAPHKQKLNSITLGRKPGRNRYRRRALAFLFCNDSFFTVFTVFEPAIHACRIEVHAGNYNKIQHLTFKVTTCFAHLSWAMVFNPNWPNTSQEISSKTGPPFKETEAAFHYNACKVWRPFAWSVCTSTQTSKRAKPPSPIRSGDDDECDEPGRSGKTA